MNALKHAMFGNALFSGFCALGFGLFSSAISNYTDIPQAVVLGIAVALGLFVALLLYGVLGPFSQTVGHIAVGLDWAWVVGSPLALMLPLSPAGRVSVVVVAILVAGFALWQSWGLKALRRA